MNFTFPRFVTPIFEFNPKGSFVPRTNIQGGFDILNKSRLYTLNSFRLGYGYIWKKSIRQEREFYPISVTYVQPFKITQAYRDSIRKDSTLLKPIERQFILGSFFKINYNELVGHIPQNAVYSNFVLDLSGNIAGLITRGNAKEGKPVKILNAEFAQYIKAEEDFRFYRKINEGAVWANRIIVGLGIPYGNSLELPFVKQFFVGGNNSLRGFRSRSVGPGAYKAPLSTRYLPDQTGDIKLEMNTEFRSRLYSMIHGAVFIDAGNVWLWNENRLKPGGKFSKDFLSEIAVDAGVGVRLDLTIFVIRFDVAFPLRKPWLSKGEQWVINNLGLNTTEGRRENIVYNLAIGYPF